MDLPGHRIVELLGPYVAVEVLKPELITSLQAYLELLIRWNAHTKLTAIREPEELVQRQIGESLFAARFFPECGTLLDFGSGAGFPGIPLQMMRPQLKVTLAESQGKKASFLREAVRSLSLPCEVWAGRVEAMPASRTFDRVTMRAVDATVAMLPVAAARVAPRGSLIRYMAGAATPGFDGWQVESEAAIPQSDGRLLCLTRL